MGAQIQISSQIQASFPIQVSRVSDLGGGGGWGGGEPCAELNSLRVPTLMVVPGPFRNLLSIFWESSGNQGLTQVV